MGRQEIAYLLIALFAGTVLAVIVLTSRYVRYNRAIKRGQRPEQPVRRPFWMG